jgi:hypothetical protein
MKRPMVAFLTQLRLAIRSRFMRRAPVEAKNLLLRQQLVVLRRKSARRVRLWNIDRLLLVWLYRLYPALLDAIIIVQPETVLAPRNFWRKMRGKEPIDENHLRRPQEYGSLPRRHPT